MAVFDITQLPSEEAVASGAMPYVGAADAGSEETKQNYRQLFLWLRMNSRHNRRPLALFTTNDRETLSKWAAALSARGGYFVEMSGQEPEGLLTVSLTDPATDATVANAIEQAAAIAKHQYVVKELTAEETAAINQKRQAAQVRRQAMIAALKDAPPPPPETAEVVAARELRRQAILELRKKILAEQPAEQPAELLEPPPPT